MKHEPVAVLYLFLKSILCYICLGIYNLHFFIYTSHFSLELTLATRKKTPKGILSLWTSADSATGY